MSIAERVLLRFCREKEAAGNLDVPSSVGLEQATMQLESSFPNFIGNLKGKRILDFGCGEGLQALAMVQEGAAFVLGIDIDKDDIVKACAKALELGLSNKTEFATDYQPERHGKFDLILSHNSFEHFNDPVSILRLLRSALVPKGELYITFGPPWLAPFGAHMQFFCRLPWVHLFFREKTIMSARSHFRSDGAHSYGEVEGGLNRMTVGRFEAILRKEGFKIKHKKCECIKKLNIFGLIPWMRELFINQVSCIVVLD